jgi:glycerol-3-phosphate O-acyltransferase
MKSNRKKSFYPFELDQKPGFFLTWFLYSLFRYVQFDKNISEDLKQMHREGTVVYAVKYKGFLDYLLYHYRFRRSRLPYPKISFDMNISLLLPVSQFIKVVKYYISFFFRQGKMPNPFSTGFFKSAIQQGTTSLLCLVDPRGFQRQFVHAEKDNLQFLLEIQKEIERPLYLVPLLLIYQKAPEKKHASLLDIFFGYKDKPGLIRKIALFFRHHRKAFIDFGRPLDLKTYLESQPEDRPMGQAASEIRQMLIESIDMQKRIILGPVMKSRQQTKEIVLKDKEILQAIRSTADGNEKQLKQLRKKAGGYFDEIAADYNIAYIQFFYRLLTWFWKKTFEGIDVRLEEMALLREWARRGPLIYVPSHKSHIDYLAINYILYLNHMHVPRVAAGKNMAFWPMGHLARKSGAIFIRRTFRGAKLYAKVFARYIKALLQEGHPLQFFIEGGRSRSGKLILPKIGFLSILLDAYREGYCEDLIFVTASINYDRIMEEKSYLEELGGGTKKKESIIQVFKARHFLNRKFGKVYIRFGKPLSLKEYLGRKGDSGKEMPTHLAFHLIQSINSVTLVTPLALIASAILTKHRRGFNLQELCDTAEIILDFLRKNEAPMATTLDNLEKTVEETLALLVYRKVVSTLDNVEEEETFYYVDEEKKRELEYYKNSIIHFFISHAFVAVSLLTGTEEEKNGETILDDCRFLTKVFKNEFIFDEEKEIYEEVDRIISYFLDSSFITKSDTNSGYKLTRLGFDKLPIWASLAKTFLESYWIASRAFIHLENKNRKKDDLLKNMNYQGQRFHKLGLIDHMEAISRITFKNAARFINEDILRGDDELPAGGDQARERLFQLNQRLYELSHFRA